MEQLLAKPETWTPEINEFVQAVWSRREALAHYLSPKTLPTFDALTRLMEKPVEEGQGPAPVDPEATNKALLKKLPGLNFFQTNRNYELEIKDGLFHIEILNKTTNTRVVFRSLLTDRNREDLRTILRDMKNRENLETLILELAPFENDADETELPSEPTPVKEFQQPEKTTNFTSILEGDELKNFVGAMVQHIKPDQVKDGVLPQLIYGRPVGDDPDLSMIFYLFKRASNKKAIYLADLTLEETLKNVMVNKHLEEHRGLFNVGRIIRLLEAVRFSSQIAKTGCSKCQGVLAKPTDLYYSLTRDDQFPKKMKAEVIGSIIAEAFTQKRDQTIYVVTDPLFSEETFVYFMTVIAQLRITNTRNFQFDRMDKTTVHLDETLEESMTMETVEEMVEKNVILEAIYDLEFDFAHPDARESLNQRKQKFKHYGPQFELSSWATTNPESMAIDQAAIASDCDALHLTCESIDSEGEAKAPGSGPQLPAGGSGLDAKPKLKLPTPGNNEVFTPKQMAEMEAQQKLASAREATKTTKSEPEKPKFQLKEGALGSKKKK